MWDLIVSVPDHRLSFYFVNDYLNSFQTIVRDHPECHIFQFQN